LKRTSFERVLSRPYRPTEISERIRGMGKATILDPARITVPTMIIHGERDFFAKEEDLLPFYSQLKTHDKRYVFLPDGGHMLIQGKRLPALPTRGVELL